MPLSEDEMRALQAERDARVSQYWGVPTTPTAPPVLPYNPNPGAANYQPNPAAPADGSVQTRAPIGASPPVPVGEQGVIGRAFNSSEPLFQVPSAPKPPPVQPDPTAIDLDDPGVVGHADAIDLDAPVRQPGAIQREMVSGVPVATSAPRQAPQASGPRAAANPDPYGIRAAQRGMVGAFDAREDAARRMTAAEQDKAIMVGDHTAELARRRAEDASVAQAEQQYAAEHFEASMTELQRQMDDVAAKKIDPKRLMKETPGLGFLAVIGGAIGGFYQGLSRSGENPFLKELNLMIDRDISAQEREIDHANKNVGQQAGLLAQQRAIFSDTQAAKMAAKALYYQAAQDELQAEAARYDSPIYQARADDGIAQIEMAKQDLLKSIGEANQRAAMAAAGQQYARNKEVQALYRDVYDKVLASTGNVAIAEAEAKRQVGVVYAPQAVGARPAQASPDPISMVPKDQRTEAVKEYTAHANKDKVVGAINHSFKAWRDTSTLSPRQLDSTRSAISGTIMANVPGIRSDVDFKEIVEPNLPARGDSEETLRLKEATIRNFVESKTVTPILDAHAPGWRNPSIDEQKASFGARKVGQ